MDLLPFALLHRQLLHEPHSNIGCCGTIRKKRIRFPQTQNNDIPKKAERGALHWIRDGKLFFVCQMDDTRQVIMCSTLQQAYNNQTVKRKVKEAGAWGAKPYLILAVLLSTMRRCGFIWCIYQLLQRPPQNNEMVQDFFSNHFVDIAVVNSHLLHKELFKQTGPFPDKAP